MKRCGEEREKRGREGRWEAGGRKWWKSKVWNLGKIQEDHKEKEVRNDLSPPPQKVLLDDLVEKPPGIMRRECF